MNTFLIVSSVLLWVIVLFNLLLTMTLIRQERSNTQDAPFNPLANILEPEVDAPKFTAETFEGSLVTLDDYAGSEFAMVFMSPTCAPCREEMPKFKELSQEARRSIVMVSIGDTEESRKFAAEFDYESEFIVAPRQENSLYSDYKVFGTPSFYLIDAQGKIKAGGYIHDLWNYVSPN